MTCRQNCSISLHINLSRAPTPTVRRERGKMEYLYHWLETEEEGQSTVDIFQNLLHAAPEDAMLGLLSTERKPRELFQIHLCMQT